MRQQGRLKALDSACTPLTISIAIVVAILRSGVGTLSEATQVKMLVNAVEANLSSKPTFATTCSSHAYYSFGSARTTLRYVKLAECYLRDPSRHMIAVLWSRDAWIHAFPAQHRPLTGALMLAVPR